MTMPEWLPNILASLPEDAHWSTKRRMAILSVCPVSRQQEALLDWMNGNTAKFEALNADINAIKTAIPKGD